LLNRPRTPLISYPYNESFHRTVSKVEELLFLNFPTDTLNLANEKLKNAITKCIGIKPIELYKGKTDYIGIIDNEQHLP